MAYVPFFVNTNSKTGAKTVMNVSKMWGLKTLSETLSMGLPKNDKILALNHQIHTVYESGNRFSNTNRSIAICF